MVNKSIFDRLGYNGRFIDVQVDVLTAKGSGLDEVGVLWGYRTKQDLLNVGCSRFASNAKELEDIIYSLK